jgi:DNA-3-methyladenine glycosylase I
LWNETTPLPAAPALIVPHHNGPIAFRAASGSAHRARSGEPANTGRLTRTTGGRMSRSAVQHRCSWAENDPLMREYHDTEWGVPQRDGRAMWEALMLDGFQAGLSWITILRKRDAFREEFRGFDPKVVARFTEKDIARALANPGIVRSRAKIEATISNARAYLKMDADGEALSSFAWSLVGDSPAKIRGDVPAKTPLSESISIALKKRGYKFVGPTTVYAWMQAVGLVNDHVAGCFRRNEL